MLKGKELFIAIGGSEPIAATKTNSIRTECGTQEATSPTTADWKEHVEKRKQWSFTVGWLLVSTGVGVNNALRLLDVGNHYNVAIYERIGGDHLKVLEGEAIMTTCDIQANVGNLVQGSFTFLGNGPLIESEREIPVAQVTLVPSSLSIEKNTSQQIEATVYPEDATNKQLQWSSSDTSVATVNQHGVVSAVEEGTCVITSSALDGSGIVATCSCNVLPEVINVSSITLSQSSGTLVVGRTLQLSASVLPSNATNKQVNWSSSNPSVASVAQNGTVTAIAAGTCVITCSATDGSGVSESCSISVQESATTNVTKYGNGLSYYYFDDNLEVLESSSVKMTDYIPVNEGDIITYTGWNYDSVRMVGYTDNYGSNPTALLIGTRVSVVTAQDVIIPANVSYIRAVGQDWAQPSAIPPRPALEVLKTVE